MSVQIVLDDLTVAYRRHPALHHVEGRFKEGSLTAVRGGKPKPPKIPPRQI